MKRTAYARTAWVAVVLSMGSNVICAQGVDALSLQPQWSADRLRQAVHAAAEQHQTECNQFLGAFLEDYGPHIFNFMILQGNRFSNKTANEQLDYFRAYWKKIGMSEAMRLADQGKVVVAGMVRQPHGHVAVVMPGGPDPQTGWPRVAGGAQTRIARSLDGQSMSRVWRSEFLRPLLQVEFYTPRENWFDTPQVPYEDVKPQRSSPKPLDLSSFIYNNNLKSTEKRAGVEDAPLPAGKIYTADIMNENNNYIFPLFGESRRVIDRKVSNWIDSHPGHRAVKSRVTTVDNELDYFKKWSSNLTTERRRIQNEIAKVTKHQNWNKQGYASNYNSSKSILDGHKNGLNEQIAYINSLQRVEGEGFLNQGSYYYVDVNGRRYSTAEYRSLINNLANIREDYRQAVADFWRSNAEGLSRDRIILPAIRDGLQSDLRRLEVKEGNYSIGYRSLMEAIPSHD